MTDDAAASDPAAELLALAARLHSAQGDERAWHAALRDCRDWFGCDGALDIGTDDLVDPLALSARIDEVVRCAEQGGGACECAGSDAVVRSRCRALGPHLRSSIQSLRHALRARLFDDAAATWILDREGRVLDANPAALAQAGNGSGLNIDQGCLRPAGASTATRFAALLPGVTAPAMFLWIARSPDGTLAERTLRLRPTAGGALPTVWA